MLVAVLDHPGAGLRRCVAVAVPGAAALAVGSDAVVLDFEFAYQHAGAVMHGEQIALGAVPIAHQGQGQGADAHGVAHQLDGHQAPAVIGLQ